MVGESDQIDYLRNYLRLPFFVLSGTDLKVFSSMGDRVADSISKILDSSNPLGEVELKKVLAAVSASLEHPRDIANDADRIPTATRRLMQTLIAMSEQPQQQARIQATMEKMQLTVP